MWTCASRPTIAHGTMSPRQPCVMSKAGEKAAHILRRSNKYESQPKLGPLEAERETHRKVVHREVRFHNYPIQFVARFHIGESVLT